MILCQKSNHSRTTYPPLRRVIIGILILTVWGSVVGAQEDRQDRDNAHLFHTMRDTLSTEQERARPADKGSEILQQLRRSWHLTEEDLAQPDLDVSHIRILKKSRELWASNLQSISSTAQIIGTVLAVGFFALANVKDNHLTTRVVGTSLVVGTACTVALIIAAAACIRCRVDTDLWIIEDRLRVNV